MYQYALNPAGPVYLTMGCVFTPEKGRLSFRTLPLTGHTPYSDGGNIEGPYRSFVDDIYPVRCLSHRSV